MKGSEDQPDVQAVQIPGGQVFDTVTIVSSLLGGIICRDVQRP